MKTHIFIIFIMSFIALCTAAIETAEQLSKLSSAGVVKQSSDNKDLEASASDRTFLLGGYGSEGYGGGYGHYPLSGGGIYGSTGNNFYNRGGYSPNSIYRGYQTGSGYGGILGGGNTGWGYYGGSGRYGGYGLTGIGYGGNDDGHSGFGGGGYNRWNTLDGHGGYGGYSTTGYGTNLGSGYRGYGGSGYGNYDYGTYPYRGSGYGSINTYSGYPSGYRGYA